MGQYYSFFFLSTQSLQGYIAIYMGNVRTFLMWTQTSSISNLLSAFGSDRTHRQVLAHYISTLYKLNILLQGHFLLLNVKVSKEFIGKTINGNICGEMILCDRSIYVNIS